MPDRTDSGQGRDALDIALDALIVAARQDNHDYSAEYAAVRKAKMEMGEEYEVRCTFSSAGPSCVYLPHNYAPGDRVRIVRIQGD